MNWIKKKLGEVLTIERGGSPRPIDKYLTNSPEGINWIKISDATASDKYIYETKEKITKDGLHKTRVVNEGDFILSNSMSFGRPYIMKSTGCIHDGWLVLKQNGKQIFEIEFLYYLLSSPFVFQQFNSKAAGSTVRNLNIALVSSVDVLIPPLPEQQRIVSILDECFSAIDKAKANAEQNLKNARELFESYLQGVFEKRSLNHDSSDLYDSPDSKNQGNQENHKNRGSDNLQGVFEKKGDCWEEQLLEDCFKMKSGDNLTAKNMTEGEYPVFGGNGIAGYHNDYNLSGSNVIIGRVGALCGNVRHINENIWLTDNAFKVVDYKFDFDNSFLTYLLNYKDLRSYARQAAQPVISNSSLKDVVLHFPKSKEQQQTIVRQLDALRAETKRLEAIYQQKLLNLEELKKSVLQKAFSGKLSEPLINTD